MSSLVVLDPASFEVPEEYEWAGGTFGIRHVTRRKARELRESVGLSPWPIDGEQLSPEKREAFERAVLDYQVAYWSGVTDEQGNELECNSENRWIFMETSELFAELVPRWSKSVWIRRQSAARAELGNSKSSSPPGPEPTGTAPSATTDVAGSETAAALES